MKEKQVQKVPGSKPEEAVVLDKQEPIIPQFAVGLQVFFEVNVKNKQLRAKANVLGWQNQNVLLTTHPLVDSRMVVVPTDTDLIVRYIYAGKVYGFNTRLIHKQQDPIPLWTLKYPAKVEMKDLRRSPRFQIIMPLTTPQGENWHTVDISCHGALLSVDRKLEVGETVKLSFTLPDGSHIEGLVASIVRTQQTEDDIFIGVNFDESKTEQLGKLRQYMSKFQKKIGQIKVSN